MQINTTIPQKISKYAEILGLNRLKLGKIKSCSEDVFEKSPSLTFSAQLNTSDLKPRLIIEECEKRVNQYFKENRKDLLFSVDKQDYQNLFIEFQSKVKQVDDQFVLRHVVEQLNNEVEIFSAMKKSQKVLNAFNEVKGNFSQISKFESDHHSFIKTSDFKRLSDSQKNIIKEDFTHNRHVESLISLLANGDKKIGNYIYEKYYLEKFHMKDAAIYKKIKNLYGTYIFAKDTPNMSFIANRLFEWRKAGKVATRLPKVIHIYPSKPLWLEAGSKASGMCVFNKTTLVFKNNALDNSRFPFDHEMVHMNDLVPLSECKSAIINPLRRSWYKKEFTNAGIAKSRINHALSDYSELKAVAIEGDMEKFSDKFKKRLMKKGLQEWVFSVNK